MIADGAGPALGDLAQVRPITLAPMPPRRTEPTPRQIVAILGPILVLLAVMYWLRARHPEAAEWFAGGLMGLVLLVPLALALEGWWYPPARRARLARLAAAKLPPPPPPKRRTDAPPVPWVGEQPWRYHTGRRRASDLTPEPRTPGELTRLPVAKDSPLTPHPDARATSLEEAEARLEQTPAVLAQWNPISWPVCCDHLATLVLADPDRDDLRAWEERCGRLDRAVEEPEYGWAEDLAAIRAGREPENGVNVFCCPVCHRVSGYHSHT